ncbi:MAG: hypothetical protein AB7Q29_05660 [Vicinamibacterales bacterium]
MVSLTGTAAAGGMNHLFQHADTGAVEEYATIEETIAPEVLSLITTWITERAASPPSDRNAGAAR